MIEEKIDTMFHKLPFHLKKEILDYIEFLSNKYRRDLSPKKKFKFDWEGGLTDNNRKMTSVELQHKAMDWR
jgi:hypothetical protein